VTTQRSNIVVVVVRLHASLLLGPTGCSAVKELS